MEIVKQMTSPIEAIFVPVGGGGLIAGIAAYVKRVRPDVKIIGVEPFDANAMALSLLHDRRVMLDQVGGFADGVAVKVVGEETFRLCRELIDGVVLVGRDAICASIKVSHLFEFFFFFFFYITHLITYSFLKLANCDCSLHYNFGKLCMIW